MCPPLPFSMAQTFSAPPFRRGTTSHGPPSSFEAPPPPVISNQSLIQPRLHGSRHWPRLVFQAAVTYRRGFKRVPVNFCGQKGQGDPQPKVVSETWVGVACGPLSIRNWPTTVCVKYTYVWINNLRPGAFWSGWILFLMRIKVFYCPSFNKRGYSRCVVYHKSDFRDLIIENPRPLATNWMMCQLLRFCKCLKWK